MSPLEKPWLFVGDDKDSRAARKALEKAGIDVQILQSDEQSPTLITRHGTYNGLLYIREFIKEVRGQEQTQP
jgi:hypothetical protein